MEKLLTVDNLKNVSLAALLLFILYAGSSGWWVYSKEYEGMKASYEKQMTILTADRDEWKNIAMEAIGFSKKISPVKIPIMSSSSENVISSEKARSELNLLKEMNKSEN